MKKLILTTLLAAAFAFGQTEGAKQSKKQTSQAKVLTCAEIDQLLSKPDQVLIIDVRRPDEIRLVKKNHG